MMAAHAALKAVSRFLSLPTDAGTVHGSAPGRDSDRLCCLLMLQAEVATRGQRLAA